jgi:glycosyltransferase involved in cell wall biosynthesis
VSEAHDEGMGIVDRITVVITTYNQPAMLAAVLEGYLAQADAGFEVVVADDGSTVETAEVVADVARRASVPVRHVWQEDRGFRAAAIRNRAVAATSAPYVVFTDGDCVPPPDFVSAHRRLARRGRFVAGNRILLGERFSERVLAERLPIHRWSRSRWIEAWRRGDVNRPWPVVPLPLGPLRRLRGRQWKGAKTCNLAVFRDDLVRIDGFDESYAGWGMEDSDLVVRLIRAGLRRTSARFAAPVFHLWHREYDRSRLPENQRQLRELLASDRVRARVGLSGHG